MKTAIIYVSFHHGNTKKVAEVIAKPLDAKLISPQDAVSLEEFGLVGFGSGVYYWKHHELILNFVDKLPKANGKKAFIFSTSGTGGTDYHKTLRSKLVEKGFEIIGEFACEGYDTWFILKLFGGKNPGRPNAKDLKDAEDFALELIQKMKNQK